MPLMDWNDRFSVGVTAIDDDHKKLIALANELFDATRAAKSREVMGKILAGLIAYTKTHFGREEMFMNRHSYARAAEHKAEHAAFTKTVLDVQKKFDAGETTVLSLQVMNFLRDWLVKHIQGSDKALGAFLVGKHAA
jgi:hemerythrin